MNWNTWQPQERANLCFIRKNRQLLLILKKRGLGAGKINAPGGKIEPGESALDAAIRETLEEICVTPLAPSERGVLHFQFADGYSLHCTVFLSEDLAGTPQPTPEADPFWIPIDAIPYESMWEDDRHWLPVLLRGDRFEGFFEFDGERMMSCEIRLLNAEQPSTP